MSRLSKALLAALALHGLLLLMHARHLPERSPVAQTKPEELVEIEETESEEAPPDVAPSAARAPSLPHVVSVPPAVARASSGAPEVESSSQSVSGAEPPSDGAGKASAVGSAQASSGQPAHEIDFGVDDGFFMRPTSDGMLRVPKPVIQRQLEAALSADDVRRGLARGGVLIGSLDAAIRDVGPVRGQALLSVIVGPDGGVTAVDFLRGDASEWSSALAAFRVLASRKRLRVPSGARGLRVTFSVQAAAERQSSGCLGAGRRAAGVCFAPYVRRRGRRYWCAAASLRARSQRRSALTARPFRSLAALPSTLGSRDRLLGGCADVYDDDILLDTERADWLP